MPTATERRILQERRAEETGWLLVPILEALLDVPCEPEDEKDFRFMDMLVRARAIPRAKGVFSPSMLGSCMRQAYFAKRGTEKLQVGNPRAHGYFLNGNFVHFKWQFALWKAHRAGMLEILPVPAETPELDFYGDGTRPGVEVRVMAEEDYGGTIDALVGIPLQDGIFHVVVDFKGINVIDFQRTVKKGAKQEYRKQLVGYVKNVQASDLPFRIDAALLISENKAGPDSSSSSSPIALHETLVKVEDFEGEVARRLRTLRYHDDKDIVPPHECVSTRHMKYQECPFNRFCTDEVKATQRERERKAENSASRPWRVSRSRD